MANKKSKKIVAIVGGLLAAGGIVALYIYFKKPKNKLIDHTVPPTPTTTVSTAKASSSSVFPLKNGSPKSDLVKQLQGYLGVTVDGLFGPKTAAALLVKAGKTQINSQSEFDAVIQKLSSAQVSNTNVARAQKLVSDWKSNTSSQLMAVKDASGYQINEDVYGALTRTGNKINLKGGQKLNRTDYVPISATQNGFLKFKVPNGNIAGLYEIDPNSMTLG